MRSFVRRAVIFGTGLLATAVWSGCEGKQATEYVTGISTQVSVPRDLMAVRVEVTVGGFSQFCRGYKVYDGKVQLPRSLGTFPNSDSALKSSGPVTYTIVGISEEFNESSENPLFSVCAQPKVGTENARILRRSRQPYIEDEILFLPMPLKYACWDKQCDGDDMTCKGGKCVPATLTDPIKSLVRYSPDLVDGTGGTCFKTELCMKAAAPAITVDPVTCTYAVPNTPSAPAPAFGQPSPFSGPSSGDGVNVEIVYDGGLVREVLDIDPEEGFSTPDPANPQRFRLAEGLCEMVKGVDAQGNATPHRITAVRASGTCQAKRLSQPICAGDALVAMGLDPSGQTPQPPPAPVCSSAELKPPQAALMVVVDNTATHQAFFDALKKTPDLNDEDTLVEPAIKTALSDPAFQRTDLGLFYAPGNAACNTTGAPDFAAGLTPAVRDGLLADLKGRGLAATPQVQLEAALDRAYNELKQAKYDPYFRRAVLVLANGGFDDAAGCPAAGGPIDRAAAALADPKKIQTYVMQLTKSPPKQASADQLAIAGGTGGSAYKAAEATIKFQEVVNSLATCVYDAEAATAPKDGDAVVYADPILGTSTKLAFNAACNVEGGPGDGWGAAPGGGANGQTRIFLCSNSCNGYRKVLADATKFSLLYNQPALSVPIFAHRAVCQ